MATPGDSPSFRSCRRCDVEQSTSEFYSGRAVCKTCTRDERREERRTWTYAQRQHARARAERYREKHRERTRESNRQSMARQKARDPEGYAARQREASKASVARRRALVAKAKARPCMDCGNQYHAVAMDLHHRDPTEKDSLVSQMMGRPVAVIRAEIAKCDVLCAVCHRLRHHELRQAEPEDVPSPDGL